MSMRYVDWAIHAKVETTTQRVVLIAVATYADRDTGACWPNRATLQEITLLSADCITRTCKRMAEIGLMTIESRFDEGGRQTSNTYRLPVLLPPAEKGGRGDAVSGGRATDDRGEGDAGSPPLRLTELSEPVRSESKEKDTRTRSRVALGAGLTKPAGVSEQTWADFLAIRKAKRAPFTETALAGLEREAGKAGMTLEATLAMCCLRGWQSFKAKWLDREEPQRGAYI